MAAENRRDELPDFTQCQNLVSIGTPNRSPGRPSEPGKVVRAAEQNEHFTTKTSGTLSGTGS